MVKIEVTVCDLCLEPGKATAHYEIRVDGGKHMLDLCDEHAAPILDLVKEVGKAQAAKRASARPSRRSARVMTMEEIEALRVKGDE